MRRFARPYVSSRIFLLILILGFLLYWAAGWYIPIPPITNEKEAIESVVYYYPEVSVYLADNEIKVADAGIIWDVRIDKDMPNIRPRDMAFEVNKVTGYVKRFPLK